MYQIPQPKNEPVFSYNVQSLERQALKQELKKQAGQKILIPARIGNEDFVGTQKRNVVMPHDHRHVLGEFTWLGEKELQKAVSAALKAKASWAALGWEDRVGIFLKAADLLAGPYRSILNAATMLGQSKNAYQAEIDSACELIDFLRFNAYYYQQIMKEQPASSPGIWNRMEYRPLEGFVLAITPFNFTAIAANLPAVPAMLGNVVLWKPSDTQMLAAYWTIKLFRDAGLPDGVINLVPADGPVAGEVLLRNENLAGIHFTGSTGTFQTIWKSVGENIQVYKEYPRIVGETGGKDFIFAHPSADEGALITALVRGAFEYQGQKCSAASRAYIPKGMWERIKEPLIQQVSDLSVGDVRDFRNFVNAVIDERSFNRIKQYLDHAKNSSDAQILVGGQTKGEKGYFVDPTVILAKNPKYRSMVEEIFGPVLSIYVYDESQLTETLEICDSTSPYGLTGAIFAQDRHAIEQLSQKLRYSAGNFYINDKPTGAVVGQQPFGGARKSGTNDKAGSSMNLYRWLSARTIKETFVPPKDYRYSFMDAE